MNSTEAAIYKSHNKEKKEQLRLFYIDELTFQIDLLKQVEKMSDMAVALRGYGFLGFNNEHALSIKILKHLLEYIQRFPDTWSPAYYDGCIQTIPKSIIDEVNKSVLPTSNELGDNNKATK